MVGVGGGGDDSFLLGGGGLQNKKKPSNLQFFKVFNSFSSSIYFSESSRK
jgi:hypothetical protein